MKKVEAIIKPDKLRLVLNALRQVGVSGVNVISTRGQGSGERFKVRGSRGEMLQAAEYNSLISIVTIVDDVLVNDVMSAIVHAAGTGSKGDGKIFVSSIEDVMDIGSGRKGPQAL